MPLKPIARILSIAGSDSGGGAGIQADIKTITALGAYASTAITALTDQNTLGVHNILPVPPDFIRAQIRSVIDDIGAETPLSFYLSVCLKTQVRCTKCDAAPSRRRGHPGRRSGGGSHMGMRTPKPLCSPPISEPPTDRLLSVYPPYPPRSCFDHILAGSSTRTAKLHMRTGASHQLLPLWPESLTCRTGYCRPPPLL